MGAREGERARYHSDCHALESTTGDALRQRDKEISAHHDAVRVHSKMTDSLAMELEQMRQNIAIEKDRSYQERESVGRGKFTDSTIPRSHAEYMRGYAEVLINAGVPDGDPMWMDLRFFLSSHVQSIALSWNAAFHLVNDSHASASSSAIVVYRPNHYPDSQPNVHDLLSRVRLSEGGLLMVEHLLATEKRG